MDLQFRPRLCLAILFCTVAWCSPARAQIAGTNVNMVSGTQWPGGDPFLQRQNEPSIAVSSRNPFHLLAGANDYRTVDLALTTNGETGDAWLGLFKSLDGGATWRSILLPGCPYNTPFCSGAPAVKNAGYQAAADPTVRAGTNGMFYYAGLVFNRGFNPHSAIIVSRLIDLNNKENADPNDILNGDAIQYISTSVVATGTSSQFLDKPSMVVDIPRFGASTCNLTVNQPGNGLVEQVFPAGNVYVAYTAFNEPPNTDPSTVTSPQESTIYLVRSTNCGASWSRPIAISRFGINQSVALAINPNNGNIYAVWRQFQQSGTASRPDAIVEAYSTNGGLSFSTPVQVSTFVPFDEGTTATSFRTNAYPTIAADASGRIYIAYSARNAVPGGDAHIVLTSSRNGLTWTQPTPIDNPPLDPILNPFGRGHQIMPTLTFAAGTLSMLYYDLRLDHTYGLFTPLFSLGQPTGLYGEMPVPAGELGLNPPLLSTVFNQFIDDSTITLRRHTFDLRIAQALPAEVPAFAPSTLVSQYAYGCCASSQSDIEQLQFNAPNLPLFRSGTAPFMGDYIDLAAGPSFLPPTASPAGDGIDNDSDDWHYNLNSSTPTTFRAAWTDNRDVQAPADGNWTHYTPPNSPSLGSTSIFQPGTSTPACQVGFTGSRNQNIYTAPISNGLIFGAPSNSKPLGTTVFNGNAVLFQRAFAVVAQNTTNQVRSFRLTIANQPVGGNASFLQFAQLTTLDLSIPGLSSATRPVFVTSTNASASVTVAIAEITAPQGTVVSGGLTSSTTLNPDLTNPAIANPAITNPAITNPAITNFEVYNPAITNPAITNPAITNPAITNPAIANPAITNANFQNVSVVNPAITNPAITNPAITNASVANPAITNPAITNVNPANTSVSDTQWTVSNTGNTEGSFTINLASSSPVPLGNVLQLIISKLYQTPAAPSGLSCNLEVETHNIVVTNIVNPVLLSPTNPAITNNGITNPAITNPTVALAPGETANIIIRVVNTNTNIYPTFNAAASVVPVTVSQSVNTQTALSGGNGGGSPIPPITVPPLQITTNSLPDAVTGSAYSATIQTVGGNPTGHTFSISSGALPAGLTLGAATGAISGIVTASGTATFSFQVQAQDVGSTLFPQHTTTQNLAIRVGSAMVFGLTTLPSATQGTPYSQTISVTGGIGTITQALTAGNLPPGLTLNGATGLISGAPTASGAFSFTIQASDSASPPQVVSQSYTVNVIATTQVAANVTFLTQPSNSIGGQILSGSPIVVQVTDNNGAAIAGVGVTMSFNGTPSCSTAILSGTLNQITNAAGQASYLDLSIDRGQLAYTLRAAVANVSAVSNPFTVNGFCPTGSLATARALHNSITLQNGKVLVAGGSPSFSNRAVAFSSAELYDPVSHSFTPVGSMHSGRSAFSMTLLQNGLVLVAGGVGGSGYLSSAELFDPATNTFTLVGSMLAARAQNTATLLASGKVLITGGDANGSVLASAELFDPSTNTFAATGQPMTSPRDIHEGILLPNGKVLITGGFASFANGPSNGLVSAELYDPTTDTFTATGNMGTGRYEHASALLPTGKVLVAGGFNGSNFSTPLASAELYDPSTGTFSPTATATQAMTGFLEPVPVLPDGTVFLISGTNAQIYDPTGGVFRVEGSTASLQFQVLTALLADGTVLVTGGVDATQTGVATAEIYYSNAPSAPIAITTGSLPSAATGQPYTQILLEQGGVGTLTWTLGSGALPSGIVLRSDGVLIGTSTTAGVFTFAVQVNDSSTPVKTATATFNLTVNGSALVFPGQTLPTAITGSTYPVPLFASGGTPPIGFAVTSGSLPSGTSLGRSGTFNGTPTTAGTFSFTVTATDSSSPPQSVSQSFTIQVVNPLTITTPSLPNGTVDTPYSAGLGSSGGLQPAGFAVTSGNLPSGLALAGNGAITGTPTTVGTYTFTVTAIDGSTPPQTASLSYTVTVNTMIPASGQNWTLLAPVGGAPMSRGDSGAAYDSSTNQMIVFAGSGSSGNNLNDVWTLGLGGTPLWTQLSPAGPLPAPRIGPATAYDDANSRLMIFGGGLGHTSPCVNDVWVLSNANSIGGSPAWTQLSPSGSAPSPRWAASAVYAPASNTLTVFGGNNCFSTRFNDVWLLSNANGLGGTPVWAQLTPSGTPPPVTNFQRAVYDQVSNRMILYGINPDNPPGSNQDAPTNQVWVLTNANGLGGTPTWIQLLPSVQGPVKTDQATVYDPSSNTMIVFGGYMRGASGAFIFTNDTWALSNANGLGGAPSWTQLNPLGGPPSIRASMAAAYDPATRRMVVFSGGNSSSSFNDAWTLSVAGAAAAPLSISPSLPTANPGVAYSQSIGVSGGTTPYSFNLTAGALPAGLTLSSTGAVGGTPTGAQGTVTFAARVTDSSTPPIATSQAVSLTVASPITITTQTLPNGTVGTPYSGSIATAGGLPPVAFSVSSASFPPGLSLSSTTAQQTVTLSGTPTAAGTFTLTITASDASVQPQAASQSYTVTIAPAVATPTNVAFVTQPQNSIEGQVLTGSSVQVLVTDATSTPIPNLPVTIGFSGTPPCAAATLGGTLTQNTDATGTATFANLSVDRGQFNYTLAAVAGTVTGVSSPFNVEGFCDTGSLAAARIFHSSVALPNGMILIAGGTSSYTASLNSALSSAELYNPATHSFTTVGNMNFPRHSFTMTLLPNGFVLVAGGYSGSAQLSSAELFDPSTNTFTLLVNSMTVARYLHAATLLPNGKVLLTGGGAPASALGTAELFDPSSNTFTATTGAMTVARSQHHADLLTNGKVLLTGGENGNFNPLASAELYDSISDTFTATGSMSTAREQQATARLFNGTVLVAGGDTGPNNTAPTATTEIYDPSVGTFSAAASAPFSIAGYYESEPVLPDGRVFLEGATNALLYDPVAGNFSVTGNMSAFQNQSQVTILPDGTALVAGGVNSNGNAVVNSEIFYPIPPSAIGITLTVLPQANQSQPYTQQLLEKGGVGNLTWILAANSPGPLPPGMTLSASGLLSGTPTQFGGFAFTVQVTDSSTPAKTATQTYALVVNPQFQFVGTQLQTAFSGIAYNAGLPLVGGTPPYTSTLTGGILPAGLTFASGAINGTTTAVGNYSLTFQATDSSTPPTTVTSTLTLGVTTPLAITTTTLPNGNVGSSYSAVISTSGGLGSVIVGLTSTNFPPGVTLSPQGVFNGTPTTAGTFAFSVTALDQSFPPQTATQSYTVTIASGAAPISLSPNPLNLLANNTGNMTVTLNSAPGGNGQVVTLSSSNTNAASVPPSVTVLPTSTSAIFPVTAGGVAGNATITASAPGSTPGSATVVVTTRPMSLTTDGPLLAVNRSFNATVTLAQRVPAGSSVSVTLAANPSGLVNISPATQTIAAGQTAAVFVLTAGTSAGSLVLTATAAGYANATAPLTITTAVISLQTGVVVAPGQSVSMALSLSQPAPPGGLTVNLSSSASGTATVTLSVFIPGGAQTPASNPQITGVLIGSATITATAAGFALDTQPVNVTVIATLTPNPVTVIANGGTATVTLAISAPAPAGGISFTLITDSSSTATVPAQAAIIQGATSAQFQVTGVAAASTTLRADSPGISEATTTVNVNPAPPISFSSLTIGQNLQSATNLFLGAAAPVGGVTVTLTTSDQALVLLSKTGKDAGSPSVQFTVGAGNSFAGTLFLYALQGAGTAQITATAPGYATSNSTVTLEPSGFIINFPSSINTTTFSSATTVQVTPALLTPGTLTWAGNQALRPGIGPFSVSLSLSGGTPGTLTPSTQTFNGGDSLQNGSFQPSTVGTATLSLGAQPAGFSTPSQFTSLSVTVTAPSINVGNLTIANNLQAATNVFLGATPPSPVTVTFTTDPAKLLLSTTGKDAGSSTVTFTNVTSSFAGTLFVYALQGTGTAQVTASAPGYATATNTVTLAPSGFIINFPSSINTTTFSSATTVQVTPALLNPGTLTWAGNQALRPGIGPFNVSLSLTGGTPGTLAPSTLTFNGGDNLQNASFQPSTAGTATLNIAAQPAGFSTPSQFTSLSVTVTAPSINVGNLTIGNNLQGATNVFLGATPPNPVTVTFTTDPAKLLLSTTGKDAGSSTVTFTNVTSSFAGTLFVYALQGTGTAQITASAPGYATATNTVTLAPSGFIINFPSSINTTTFSSATTVQVTPALLNPGTLTWAGNQALRPGIGPFNVSLSLTGGTPGTLAPSTLTFIGGDNLQNASFQPSTAGTATLSIAAQPAGFSTPGQFTSSSVTVTAPGINAPSNIAVGLNLQVSINIFLQTAPPNPVALTVTSPNASIAAITMDSAAVGGNTVTFTNVTSTFVGTITIQGMSLNSTQLKIQAPGYSDAFVNVVVDPSGFIINNIGNFTANAGSNTTIQITSAILDPNTLNWAGNQFVRAGFSVNVGVVSSNTTVGAITTSPIAFPGDSFAGNTVFQALSPGTTFISVIPPAGFSTPGDFQTVQATVQ